MRKTLLRMTATLAMMVGALAGLSVAWSAPASAETFAVETTADSGPSSLRQAVADANATAEADTIVFGIDAGATITLSSTLTVTNPLSIEAPPLRPLTISGGNAVRPFYVDATTLNISGLTIADGRTPDGTVEAVANYGGAIYNDRGNLTIRNSALTSSGPTDYGCVLSPDAYRGGAIYNVGYLNLIDSSIRGYCAHHGGAIYNAPALLLPRATLTNSSLSDNAADSGGAVYNAAPSTLRVRAGSRLDNNRVIRNGGGIFSSDGGVIEVEITDSTLSNNQAIDDFLGHGGGIYTTGNTVVERSTFSGNVAGEDGGGLYAGSGSQVEMGDSTFSGNTGYDDGGGLYTRSGSQVEMGDSTFSGNVAKENGGGIAYAGDSATITNSTVTGNGDEFSAGGIWVSPVAATAPTIGGSIVAGNTAPSGNPDVEGNFTDGGFNIIGGTAGAAGLQTDAQGKPVLADNGGPTKTVALVRGGKAIDQGNSFGSTTDQRGTPRPKDYASAENAAGGDGSDAGAFEYVDPDASAPTVEAAPTPLPNEDGLNSSDVTVTIDASDEENGSGVWRVSYSASGAQQVPEQNVESDKADLVISADGETVVTYWATDNAGNRSESRTLTLRLDKTPPETSISSGPSGPTRRTSASFVFSSPEAGATFECSVDGGAFEACSSPEDYSALTDGEHTFSVRAKDGLGNADATPAVRTWKVDTVRPTGKVLINNGRVTTTARAVTLRLDARDPAPGSGVVSMRFKNGGPEAWSDWRPYAASASWRLEAGAGKKTVHVQYRDAAGNVSASTSDSIGYRP